MTTKSVPVSVAVPAYNCAKTIAKCIKSINTGSVKPEEILISYDKSVDGTLIELTKLKKLYNNIVLVVNNGRNSAAANRNNALIHSKKDILTHVDADDTVGKFKLENEFKQIERGKLVSFSDYQIVRKAYVPGCRVHFPTFFYLLESNKLTTTDLINRTYGVPRDLMFERKIWEKVGLFDTELKMYEDLDFKIRLFLEYQDWGYTAVAGTYYRQTQNSLSRSDDYVKMNCVKKLRVKYETQTILPGRFNQQKIEKSIMDYYFTKFGLVR